MATTVTRFEIWLPLFADGTAGANAVAQFVQNMATLCPVIHGDAYVTPLNGQLNVSDQQVKLLYGQITLTQQATALGFLNTLNQALGAPVNCIAFNVSTQP